MLLSVVQTVLIPWLVPLALLSSPRPSLAFSIGAGVFGNGDGEDNDSDDDDDSGYAYYSQAGDTVPTTSIIDVLSANESYSHLLLTLQKSDLVDYVNELANVTFLAPVNAAFEKHEIPIGSTLSKDELNRFIVDDVVFREEVSGIRIVSTLNHHGSPYIEGFQIPLLLDHRFDETDDNKEIYLVENARVLGEDQYIPTIDTVVLTIDDLLTDPKETVCRYFQDSLNRNTGAERFKTFSSLLLSESTCKAQRMSNMTFLTPSDASIHLNHVERKYLSHIRGLDDKNLFISNFLVDGIIGGNLGNGSVTASNWNNEKLTFTSSYLGDEIIINNKIRSTTSNFLLSDGIIHYFEDTIFDYNDTKKFPLFTLRKYLIGLDYEDFVDEIDFRKLSDLIDDNSLHQTVLVSSDYRMMGSLKNGMLYHFLEGDDKISLQKFENGLLTTKYCVDTDMGSTFCQKIKLETSPSGERTLNSNSKILNTRPYKVGNSSIYIIDDDISLPSKLQTAIASELTGYGKSTEFLKKFNYSKKLSKDNSFYTLFLPATDLWNALDLTLDYLIENPVLLQEILDNLVLKGVLYHDFEGTQEFETYGNSKVEISKDDSSSDVLNVNNSTNLTISFDSQILYSNGVIHPIDDDIPLPQGMRISNLDLLSAQDSTEFEKILDVLNLTSVLDSTKGYSVMLPSSKSLLQENITYTMGDLTFLEKFAKLHILPPGSLDMILDCSSANSLPSSSYLHVDYRNSTTSSDIPTMMNGTHLTCRELASGGMMLSLTEGSGNEVRVLRHGIAIDNTTITSGLLLLDRPLNPLWMNNSDGKLYLHLPLFAILVGILIGVVCVLMTCGCCLVLTFGSSKKIVDGIEHERYMDDGGRIEHVISVTETMPLLNDNDNDNNNTDNKKSSDNNKKNNGVNGGTGKNTTSYMIDRTNGQGQNSSSRVLGRSLGRDSPSLENKGREVGRRYSTFDARYSMNASASPIDVNSSII